MSTRRRISTNFQVEEFDCHDGTRVPTEAIPRLVEWCRVWGEPLRREFGPVLVLSGYRDRAYNAAIGGARGSYHVYDQHVAAGSVQAPARGVAVDVKPARGNPVKWQAWAVRRRGQVASLGRAGRGGIGLYVASGFVHLDTGPLRDWRG